MRYVAKESKNAITRLWIQKNIFRISPRSQCKKEANIPRSFWEDCKIGRSEKPKSWKSKNGQADYLPRHSPDVRTVFEIKIRPLVFCEIGQMRFTEKGINFKKPRRRHFTEKSPNFMKPSQI